MLELLSRAEEEEDSEPACPGIADCVWGSEEEPSGECGDGVARGETVGESLAVKLVEHALGGVADCD